MSSHAFRHDCVNNSNDQKDVLYIAYTCAKLAGPHAKPSHGNTFVLRRSRSGVSGLQSMMRLEKGLDVASSKTATIPLALFPGNMSR